VAYWGDWRKVPVDDQRHHCHGGQLWFGFRWFSDKPLSRLFISPQYKLRICLTKMSLIFNIQLGGGGAYATPCIVLILEWKGRRISKHNMKLREIQA
jgi:hypothetical protein